MARHLRMPEERITHPFGVLAIAVGVSLLVIALLSSRPGGQGDDLGQRASVTSETVLGEVVEPTTTTLGEAAPAEAVGFTTTTPSTEAPPEGSPATAPPSPPQTSPTIGPSVHITAPPPPPPTTTTTTRPPTTTTSTTTTICNFPPCE